jgi:hypothetical protein
MFLKKRLQRRRNICTMKIYWNRAMFTRGNFMRFLGGVVVFCRHAQSFRDSGRLKEKAS